MPRFFIKQAQIQDNLIVISDEDAHHIVKVLRLKPDDQINCIDEDGVTHLTKIKEVSPGHVVCEVVASNLVVSESPLGLTLFQALAKGDKMDWVIQKSVELGVREIIPFSSRRTILQLNKKQAINRQERWQRIAHEAAKQSGRTRVPKVGEILSFNQVIESVQVRIKRGELILTAYEAEKNQGLNTITVKPQSVAVLIGPEGGFDTEEVDRLVEVGAKSVTLGPRILRTETAGLVALSLLGFKWGDLG